MATALAIALAGATGPLWGQPRAPSVPARSGVRGRVKNLIFLVSDGMNLGTLSLANHYSEEFLGQSCEWMKLYQSGRPVSRSLVETSSASSLVTDSAAAGSAWSCGRRIPNGALNIAADGAELTPLFDLAKARGKATGVVSTTRVTHATPASFIVSHPERNDEDVIAQKLLSRGTADVILGGGSRHFSPDHREDGLDLFQAFEARGYALLRDREGLLQAKRREDDRLLGTFFGSHLPYSLDRQRQPELQAEVPSLREMMDLALHRLQRSPEGFVLQVEGGRVDHAGHANDAAAIIQDQLAFDECIPLALAFADAHPDTLVIVTTDHGTGGAQLNGMGSRYNGTDALFQNLRSIEASFEFVERQLSADPTVEELRGLVRRFLQVDLPATEAERILEGRRNEEAYVFSAIVGPLLYPFTGVNFTSHAHTGDLVDFVAVGPGADAIPAYHENHQLLGILRPLLGI